jgi:hypothetical protein
MEDIEGGPMTYTTIDETNITGISGLFLYAADVLPSFMPMVFFAIFMIAMLGTFFAQKRLEGRSDFLSSFAAASWFTTIVAFILSLVPDLVNFFTLSVLIVLSIISGVLLLTSGERVP